MGNVVEESGGFQMIQLCNAFKSSSAIIHGPEPKRLETASCPIPSYAVLIRRLPERIYA